MASRKGLYLSLITFIFHCCATEYQPWIGPYMEFEWRNSILSQRYQKVASDSHFTHYSSQDLFLHTSLVDSVGYFFALEFEGVGALTRKQNCHVDHIRLNGRYVWLDDVAGDPMSLTFGFSLIQAFKPSNKDISSFHHGLSEAEIFVSAGKEYAIGDEWASRWWTVLGIGSAAQRGSPWIRANGVYEFHILPRDTIRIFINTLWGLGSRRLCTHDFDGYGSVQHQSVDIGLRYTKIIDYCGHLSIEYGYRPYARNYPAQAYFVLLNYLCTFSF